jgi:hypothetical protein
MERNVISGRIPCRVRRIPSVFDFEAISPLSRMCFVATLSKHVSGKSSLSPNILDVSQIATDPKAAAQLHSVHPVEKFLKHILNQIPSGKQKGRVAAHGSWVLFGRSFSDAWSCLRSSRTLDVQDRVSRNVGLIFIRRACGGISSSPSGSHISFTHPVSSLGFFVGDLAD